MLRLIVSQFEKLSLSYGVEPVCTRVIGKIEGDSGIHSMGLAADFRSQFGDTFIYTVDQQTAILKAINELFPRTDEHKTIKHHSFNGAPYHFHLQCSPNIGVYSQMIYQTFPNDDDLMPVA